MLLLSDEFRRFGAATICFYLAAAWILGRIIMWSVFTSETIVVRIIATFLAFGVVGVGLTEAIRAADHRENTLRVVEQEPARPPAPQQTSTGDNSPNTTVTGNNNAVTVNSSDPTVHRKLDAITKLLKAQGGKDNLLQKYPLGYVIFEVDYVTNAVTPLETRKGVEEYQYDFRPVRVTRNTADRIVIRLPDLIKNKKVVVSGAETGGVKRVGNLGGYVSQDNNGVGMMVLGEILTINGSEITFLVGFDRAPK
jgi:hypothetical protein